MKLKEKLEQALTNREYKSVLRRAAYAHRYGNRGYCSICEGRCGWMYLRNKKRNNGQQSKKLKPWQKGLAKL